MPTIRIPILLLLTLGLLAAEEEPPPGSPPPFAEWGEEALRVVHEDLWMPERELYAEDYAIGDGRRGHPSFMWGVGVQLSALVAAARVEPDRYLASACAYADAIQVYWLEHDGIAGYDVQPGPKTSDRYYDDNAWLVLALAELFEVSREPRFLERAEATFRFVMSGEDDTFDGGIYWRESPRGSKNTCTNAPAIVAALRLYQLTAKGDYRETADRLYRWTSTVLRDDDGLYWDSIRADGSFDERKFSYNTALMIRANALFHAITGEGGYLVEARRSAAAAEERWVTPEGAVEDSGRFAHLLLESFLALQREDHEAHWAGLVTRCLVHLHVEIRNEDGRYGSYWAPRRQRPLRETTLLNQASPARIYWVAAAEIPDS